MGDGLGPVKPVLAFDLDGTISLVRHGWQEVMTAVMAEVLLAAGGDAELAAGLARAVVDETNGTPVTRQMETLASRARDLGLAAIDTPSSAVEYQTRIKRLSAARREQGPASALLVPGALEFVSWARGVGFPCALVSSSSLVDVEADLVALSMAELFGPLVLAPDDAADSGAFSKLTTFWDLLGRTGAPSLIAFGDGPGEIQAAVAVGGTGIGVAFDPSDPDQPAPALAARLRQAGAALIIRDFNAPARKALSTLIS